MAICYDRLWKLLIDKKMNRTELKETSGISFNVLARLGKNEPVSFESIEKICFTLNCNIEDIVEIQRDNFIENVPKHYTTIELFAGAGGLALGIEKAGFDTLGLIEFDKDASDSLKKNRPDWRVINEDVANISCLNLEEYFGIKKLKVLNFIAFCLSIVVAICIYVLLYKFDNIYRVIISLLISILICVFAIKRNRESFYDVANKLVSNEMLELTINKNKNYNLLNIKLYFSCYLSLHINALKFNQSN